MPLFTCPICQNKSASRITLNTDSDFELQMCAECYRRSLRHHPKSDGAISPAQVDAMIRRSYDPDNNDPLLDQNVVLKKLKNIYECGEQSTEQMNLENEKKMRILSAWFTDDEQEDQIITELLALFVEVLGYIPDVQDKKA